jgi:hypothetical protein
MTQDEQILAALAAVEQARKDIAELQTLNLDSALQTGGPRVSRGSSTSKVQHGVVVVKVKDGIMRAEDGETPIAGPVIGAPPDPVTAVDGVDHKLYRTTTPMRSKHQRTMINKIWKYRNFKKCGQCGCFDTYKSRSLADTHGVDVWCYQCGAQDEDVLQEFQPLPEPKHKQRTCADCGKEIWATRGDLMFPTGEKDPGTGQPDYRCLGCKTKLDVAAKK